MFCKIIHGVHDHTVMSVQYFTPRTDGRFNSLRTAGYAHCQAVKRNNPHQAMSLLLTAPIGDLRDFHPPNIPEQNLPAINQILERVCAHARVGVHVRVHMHACLHIHCPRGDLWHPAQQSGSNAAGSAWLLRCHLWQQLARPVHPAPPCGVPGRAASSAQCPCKGSRAAATSSC